MTTDQQLSAVGTTTVKLAYGDWFKLGGILATITIFLVGAAFKVSDRLAALESTVSAQGRQIDRLEGRIDDRHARRRAAVENDE